MTTSIFNPNAPIRPMLFSTAMVKAIAADAKTETRRVIKPQPTRGQEFIRMSFDWNGKAQGEFETPSDYQGEGTMYHPLCPYGKAGDRLWVRESFFAYGKFERTGQKTKAGKDRLRFRDLTPEGSYRYATQEARPPSADRFKPGWVRRPAIFMPRRACRYELLIDAITIERLQAITAGAVAREGLAVDSFTWAGVSATDRALNTINYFSIGWNTINGRRKGCNWSDNPFVWVISFVRLADVSLN